MEETGGEGTKIEEQSDYNPKRKNSADNWEQSISFPVNYITEVHYADSKREFFS